MSEDFDSSPRASKRRKVSTYSSSRSTLPDNDTSVPSVWDNVTSSVSGLSRRLFVGAKSSKSAQPNESTSAPQEDVLEIPESDAEVATEEIIVGSGQRTRKSEAAATRKSAGAHTLKEVNPDSSQAKQSSDEVMEDGDEDRITIQPRSSGRERKRSRKYSIGGDKVEPKNKSITKASAKLTGSKKHSGKKSAEGTKLVGILTPSKRNEKKARKSVAFGDGEKQIEQDFGFKDISTTAKISQKPALEIQQSTRSSKLPKKVKQKPQAEAVLAQPEPEFAEIFDEEVLFETLPFHATALEDHCVVEEQENPTQDPLELQSIKRTVLARLTHHAANNEHLPLPSHLSNAYNTLYTLLQKTVSSGESNSLLLLGSRGTGKSLLVDTALDNLRRSSLTEFHTVRLSGFVQTDDRLALREIWRQLGREMEVDEEETNQVVGSYADTMTSLLGLLSQPEEVPDIGAVEYVAEKIVTKSVVFVLDEFDLFTTHSRQTLLYNLFDIAQSRKAPIAVIGCSARTDCVECLEKRVKSRFSHRWVHVGPPKSLAAFQDVARDNLLVSEVQVGMKKQEQEWTAKWNEYIKSTFLPSSVVQALISGTFFTTRSLSDLFAALYSLVAIATVSEPPKSTLLSSQPPSLLSLLPSLPYVHLSLLVCATRLEAIHSLTQLNFNIVYAHYTDLLAKSKLAASVSGATASSMRAWGKDACLMAWEELVHWHLLVKVGGKDEGMGEDGRMYRIDVSIEEVRWAVEKNGAVEGLEKWCKEI